MSIMLCAYGSFSVSLKHRVQDTVRLAGIDGGHARRNGKVKDALQTDRRTKVVSLCPAMGIAHRRCGV